MPKAIEVAGIERDQKPGFRLRKGSYSGPKPPVPPGGTCSKARISRNGAGQPWSCGPGQCKARQAGPDGSRISPGSGAQPLRTRMAAAAGACVAIQLGPRAGADRPPLPHASRTNKTLRSGLCEGLVAGRERRARGRAAALGDLRASVFRERRAEQPPPSPARLCG